MSGNCTSWRLNRKSAELAIQRCRQAEFLLERGAFLQRKPLYDQPANAPVVFIEFGNDFLPLALRDADNVVAFFGGDQCFSGESITLEAIRNLRPERPGAGKLPVM